MATTTRYVSGMTCDHCVQAVTTEVSGIDGVTHVRVHLDTGRVDIESKRPVPDEAFAAAVTEAGYEVAG